jgi:hypothetical protein
MMNAALPNDPAALKDLLLKQQRAHLERTVLLQSQLENMAAQTSAFQTRIEVLEPKEQQFAQRMTELQRKNDDLTVDKLRLEYRLMVLLKRYYGPRADKIGTGSRRAGTRIRRASGTKATGSTQGCHRGMRSRPGVPG